MTFRNERKFMTDSAAAGIIRARAAAVLTPDAHAPDGFYTVNNLYFDDMYDTAYHEKLGGTANREKWRARWYNGDRSTERLERKIKRGELVAKRSAKFGDPDDPLLIKFRELQNTRRLGPVLFSDYRREAFTYLAGNVRITFDTGLEAGNGGVMQSAMGAGQTIIEVKYDGFLPSVVRSLFGGVPLTQTAVSKYIMSRDILRRTHAFGITGDYRRLAAN
ncbi:molecular chaperone [Clostridia bacterium]|nr:molecular chaperone [Clostridia bacterium]